MITLDTFAKLLYHRDVKVVGKKEAGKWDEVRQEYIEEANFYLSKKPEDWPCHILFSIGQHNVYHQGCDSTKGVV